MTLNGPLSRSHDVGERCHFSGAQDDEDHFQQQLLRCFNRDFEQPTSEDKKGLSIHDKQALKILEESLRFVIAIIR